MIYYSKDLIIMTLYCSRCGTINEDVSEFCSNCGESLTKAKEFKIGSKIKGQSGFTYDAWQKIEKKLYRSRDNKIITGLAAGLAKYFEIDIDLSRILWVIALIASGGVVVLIYFILTLAVPLEPENE